jgi:proteasome lid subunit RPN8/RPN11
MSGGGVNVPGLTRRIKSQIYDHVYRNATHEVGGVLVGRLGDRELPQVTGAIAALEARGERASVTFTHEAWANVHDRLERDFAGQQIVGWYHSHPGFGIFLSRHDLFIHENFFSDPRHIAYVVDPHAGTEGVFGWRHGAVVPLEECPAGRPGTGGRPVVAAPRRRWDAHYAMVLALTAVVGLMFGVGTEVLLDGSDSSARSGTSAATTSATPTPTPTPVATAATPSSTAPPAGRP